MFFLNFAASVKTQTGKNVVVLRSDNGGEYTGKEFRNKLLQLGIRHETSAPYTPAQNGVAERSNRTILNAARSVIYSSRVPIQLWAEAIAYSVYTLNRVLSSTSEITPYESWYKKRPDVSHLRIFGSRTFVHIPESLHKKLDPKSREGIFVGYCETSKAFSVWISNIQKLLLFAMYSLMKLTKFFLTQTFLFRKHSGFPRMRHNLRRIFLNWRIPTTHVSLRKLHPNSRHRCFQESRWKLKQNLVPIPSKKPGHVRSFLSPTSIRTSQQPFKNNPDRNQGVHYEFPSPQRNTESGESH